MPADFLCTSAAGQNRIEECVKQKLTSLFSVFYYFYNFTMRQLPFSQISNRF
jgi:hypothetical protein